MTDRLVELCEWAEQALADAKVAAWEVAADEVHAVAVEVLDGELSVLEQSLERSLGIRVIAGGIGFAGLSEPTRAAVERAVEDAVGEARRARPAALSTFAGPERCGPGGAPFVDPRAEGAARSMLIDRAKELEAAVLAHPGIARVRPARLDEERGRFVLRTSAGAQVEELHSRASAMVGAVAEDGDDVQSAYAHTSEGAADALAFGPMAAEAAEAAVSLLGAGSFRTDRVPLLLGPEAAAELMALLISALSGERIERGASFLGGKLGTAVLSPALTVWDDPHAAHLDGAVWHDGEGLRTAAAALIDRGVVARYLDDLESAARSARAPGGQATRGAARERPAPGAHNLVVRAGPHPLAALLARGEGGLYAHELSGAHTMNEITGELSLGVRGWAIRGAALGPPVEGVMIAGRLLELLGGQVEVGAVPKRMGAIEVPPILLPEVQVSAA